jgi:hypothetical protein
MPVEDCSQEEADLIRHHHRGPSIQLLSLDSVAPMRPLLNGFRATTIEKSLDRLSMWIQTCHESHEDTCQHGKLPNVPSAFKLDNDSCYQFCKAVIN